MANLLLDAYVCGLTMITAGAQQEYFFLIQLFNSNLN